MVVLAGHPRDHDCADRRVAAVRVCRDQKGRTDGHARGGGQARYQGGGVFRHADLTAIIATTGLQNLAQPLALLMHVGPLNGELDMHGAHGNIQGNDSIGGFSFETHAR